MNLWRGNPITFTVSTEVYANSEQTARYHPPACAALIGSENRNW